AFLIASSPTLSAFFAAIVFAAKLRAASVAEELGHLGPQQGNLLLRLAEISEQLQVVATHGSAAEQPSPHAKQFIHLDKLAVTDKNPVLADQRLDQALKFAEDVRREKQRPVILLFAIAARVGMAREKERQIARRLEQVVQRTMPLDPRLLIQLA